MTLTDTEMFTSDNIIAGLHYLTCQACGRETKAREGLIAHHGHKKIKGLYEGDRGYHEDACCGSRELPLERAKNVLEAIIRGNLVAIDNLWDEMDDVQCPDCIMELPTPHVYKGKNYRTKLGPDDYAEKSKDYKAVMTVAPHLDTYDKLRLSEVKTIEAEIERRQKADKRMKAKAAAWVQRISDDVWHEIMMAKHTKRHAAVNKSWQVRHGDDRAAPQVLYVYEYGMRVAMLAAAPNGRIMESVIMPGETNAWEVVNSHDTWEDAKKVCGDDLRSA